MDERNSFRNHSNSIPENRFLVQFSPFLAGLPTERAVKRMKELPDLYGNLFKSNVVSGIGASSATGGLMSGGKGNLDLEKVAQDPVLYRKIRAEHPEWLGLK